MKERGSASLPPSPSPCFRFLPHHQSSSIPPIFSTCCCVLFFSQDKQIKKKKTPMSSNVFQSARLTATPKNIVFFFSLSGVSWVRSCVKNNANAVAALRGCAAETTEWNHMRTSQRGSTLVWLRAIPAPLAPKGWGGRGGRMCACSRNTNKGRQEGKIVSQRGRSHGTSSRATTTTRHFFFPSNLKNDGKMILKTASNSQHFLFVFLANC